MQAKHTPASARALLAVAICAVAVAAASCSSGSTPPGGQATHPSQPPAASTAPTTPATSTSPATCPTSWTTGSTTVAHQVSVPPVPVVTDIRTATHPECKYDRVVLDISGATPGYVVSFVPKVIQDASGRTVHLPGTKFLVIRLEPAQGHNDNGTATLPTGVHVLSYPQLKSYAVSGDFEGVVSIALGLAGGTKYRVGELPGKVYVDVAW